MVYILGCGENIKYMLGGAAGFPVGSLPFKYLGIPLTSRRLSVIECEMNVEKMTSKIRHWQSRNLSYAARLQLVNIVLMGVTNYWCQIFIFPKMLLRMVNDVCRSFLWHGSPNNSSTRNVAWLDVCNPKKEGGLGIRNLEVWNMVVIGKIEWHINNLKESLWVWWDHGVYTQRAN